MKNLFCVIGLLTFLIWGAEAYGFGGCEEDCQKCHSFEAREAKDILSKMKAPDAKVLDIRMSPIRGLWELSFEDKGNRRIVYVGFSKKYIVGGSIYEVETASNKTQETLADVKRAPERYVDVSKIPLEGSILLGEKAASNKVIVFTDPDCPFCSKLHGELKKILSERKDIAFYIKLLPLKFHPDAYWKSKSIMCGNSMQLLEENFEKKPIPKPGCETSVVDENLKLGEKLDITGTPTLVMPSGLVVIGAKDAKTITELALSGGGKGAVK